MNPPSHEAAPAGTFSMENAQNIALAAAYAAEHLLAKVRQKAEELRLNLRRQEELAELISLCMTHLNMGSMSNPMQATMTMMAAGLPVWPSLEKNIEELENARDAEAEQAEKLLNEMFSLTELAKNDIALLHEHAS